MHAVVKTEKGRPRVLQVGLRNILNPVEGAVLVPALMAGLRTATPQNPS